MENLWVGKIGEDTVAQYLISKQYKIVERNFRVDFGELDIITRDNMGTLVFIEVKTLISPTDDSRKPEDNFSAAKLKKFRRAAEYYAALHPEYINEELGYRLDVVALECPRADALVDAQKLCNIRHYENVLY